MSSPFGLAAAAATVAKVLLAEATAENTKIDSRQTSEHRCSDSAPDVAPGAQAVATDAQAVATNAQASIPAGACSSKNERDL